jgi:hypothetical protein
MQLPDLWLPGWAAAALTMIGAACVVGSTVVAAALWQFSKTNEEPPAPAIELDANARELFGLPEPSPRGRRRELARFLVREYGLLRLPLEDWPPDLVDQLIDCPTIEGLDVFLEESLAILRIPEEVQR